jgi:prevent-host-death family protein
MTDLSISEAEEQFAEVFRRAAHDKERIYITRDGKRVAAIISIEDFEALEAIEDRFDREEIEKACAEAKEKGTTP